jgi:hypothetical protein
MKKPKKKIPAQASKTEKSSKKAKPAHAKPPLVPALDATPVDQVKAMAAKAKASIAYVRGLFPKLSTISAEERARAMGRLSDGEEAAARAILDADGRGASKGPPDLRDRLERRAALVDVASSLEKLLEEVSDTALIFGELVRPALGVAASDEAAQ